MCAAVVNACNQTDCRGVGSPTQQTPLARDRSCGDNLIDTLTRLLTRAPLSLSLSLLTIIHMMYLFSCIVLKIKFPEYANENKSSFMYCE